jgi:hypothetical protein
VEDYKGKKTSDCHGVAQKSTVSIYSSPWPSPRSQTSRHTLLRSPYLPPIVLGTVGNLGEHEERDPWRSIADLLMRDLWGGCVRS